MLHSFPTHTHSPNTPYPAHMGYQDYPSLDPTAADFRAFYPYTPNEVKHRKRTTSAQLKVLETIFKKDTKPNASLRNELASQLDMSARGVQVWFQNRRAKEKLKAGKFSPGSKNLGSTSPNSSIDQELCPIKAETDSLIPSLDSSDHFDAYSQSSSPPLTSPPQLHLITDADSFYWNNSPVEPPDSATFISRPNIFPDTNDLYSHRRGSLPANAFPPEHSSQSPQLDCFDPLVRRRSIDASLQRLASNPFAGLARAKNSALYGPGFGVLPQGRHHQLSHLPYGHPSQRRGLSQLTAMPQHANLRRLSMDSRSIRVPSRLNQSPSPSPLTPYNAVRASLPGHLCTVAPRTVASPIPGPLPSPGFSFGAASTPSMTSPSSGDSERNSPDSLQSFTFRTEDNEEDGAPSHYEVYSRFGSIASIATSDSSINSSYFSELGGTGDVGAEDRRNSCSSGQFLGLMSGLDVSGQVEHTPNSLNLAQYSPHEDYPYAGTNDGVELINSHEMHHQQQQQQQTEGAYPSPASTISPRGTPHSQDSSAPVVPISTTSELAFALESKPTDQTSGSRQESYMVYGDHHNQNHLSATVAVATATSHGHGHRTVDRNATDHDEVDYYTGQHQHEGDATNVYHQETSSIAVNSHSHYIATSYSSLSDAYPGATDQQLDFGHCGRGDVVPTYTTSAYGETLSSVLGASGIQPTEAFTSYST